MKTYTYVLAFLLCVLNLSAVKAQNSPVRVNTMYDCSNCHINIDTIQNDVVYTNTYDIPGADRLELFARAEEFLAQQSVEKDAFTSLNDQANGLLITKIAIAYPEDGLSTSDHGTITFTLNIQVKDGKYRYVINNFYVESTNTAAPIKLTNFLKFLTTYSPDTRRQLISFLFCHINGFQGATPATYNLKKTQDLVYDGLIKSLVTTMSRQSLRGSQW